MIINPVRRDGFNDLSDYLNGEGANAEENEECNFLATGNSLGIDSVNSWCIFANRMAEPKRGGRNPLKEPIEHISIRSRDGEILTPKMILPRVPRLLKALGYENCPWVLVKHEKKVGNGNVEPHYHLVILRIDDKGRVPNPNNLPVCIRMADEFALEFGWQPASADAPKDKPYPKRSLKFDGLWDDAANMQPKERLQHFIKNGFVPTRGDAGQLIFCDREGKPHSPQRLPAIKALKLRRQDMPGLFGFDKESLGKLPLFKKVSAAIKASGWKTPRNIIVKGIADEQRHILYRSFRGRPVGKDFGIDFTSRPPMSASMSARSDLRLQGQGGSLLHGNAPKSGLHTDEKLFIIQTKNAGHLGRDHKTSQGKDLGRVPKFRRDSVSVNDTTAQGRAAAAYEAVFAKYAAMIDAVSQDKSLTDEQRAAAIVALRQRQKLEATAARRRILDEEKSAAKARRRYYAALNIIPK